MSNYSNCDPFFDESDLNEPSFRCEHGTFLGNPYGADYICGACEDGISMEELRRNAYEDAMRDLNALEAQYSQIVGVIVGTKSDFSLALANTTFQRTLDYYDGVASRIPEVLIGEWVEGKNK